MYVNVTFDEIYTDSGLVFACNEYCPFLRALKWNAADVKTRTTALTLMMRNSHEIRSFFMTLKLGRAGDRFGDYSCNTLPHFALLHRTYSQNFDV